MITQTDRKPSAERDPVPHLPPALVIGGDASAIIASNALSALGIDVTLVKTPSEGDELFQSLPRMDLERHVSNLAEESKRITGLDSETMPEIRRMGTGFEARLDNGEKAFYGCVFLAPGVALAPPKSNLPKGVEVLTSGGLSPTGEKIGFLLDYESPSSASVGMFAIEQATRNAKTGGESYVIFRNVPVPHLWGESLYENAKRSGVRFYRFGEDLPAITEESTGGELGRGFRITMKDCIDIDAEVNFELDRLFAATSPDSSSISDAARSILAQDLDAQQFLITESIHCLGGRSFHNGVFSVGAATGELDWIRVSAQAAAAAARARAWMLWAQSQEESETVSIRENCCRCLTCTRICPHGAISFQSGTARSLIQVNGWICEECGVCVSECPQIAMDIIAFPEPAIRSFLDDVTESASSRPVVVYGCHRSPGRASRDASLPDNTLFFTVKCGGRVSESMLLQTLAAGARGVLVMGCHNGNCSSSNGSEWAAARVRNVIAALNLPPDIPAPVGFATVAANETARFSRLVKEFFASFA